MREQSLIYEVDLEADARAEDALDRWLETFMAQALRLPGFLAARVESRDAPTHEHPAQDPRSEPAAGSTPAQHEGVAAAPSIRRRVRFEIASREDLARYLREDAERMQADAQVATSQRLRVWRHAINPASAEAVATGTRLCRNCAASLDGQYCMVCGQRDRARMISVWELLRDFVGDFFDLDSRLWRTVFPLIFRPGRLTRDYLAGRRVYYTPPLRLYLILSVGFFLLATWGGSDIDPLLETDGAAENAGDAPGEPSVDSAKKVPATQPDEGSVRVPRPAGEEDSRVASPAADGEDFPATPSAADTGDWSDGDGSFCTQGRLETDIEWLNSPGVQRRLYHVCRSLEADQGAAFLDLLVDNLPTMVLVFLPLIAFAMKLLYLGSRRFYVEHLLFIVHYHSFVFLALGLVIVLHRMPESLTTVDIAAGLATAGFLIYSPIYLFRSMRLVYGQSRTVTAIKFLSLQVAYVIGMLLMFLLGVVFTALTL